MSDQTRRSSFIAMRNLSAGPAVIVTNGIRNSLAHLPMNASACHRRMKRKDLVVCAVAIRVDIDPVLLVVRLSHERSDEAEFLHRDAQPLRGACGEVAHRDE